jgi:hypothetical protein
MPNGQAVPWIGQGVTRARPQGQTATLRGVGNSNLREEQQAWT